MGGFTWEKRGEEREDDECFRWSFPRVGGEPLFHIEE